MKIIEDSKKEYKCLYEGLKGGNIVERTGGERSGSGSQFGKQEREEKSKPQ